MHSMGVPQTTITYMSRFEKKTNKPRQPPPKQELKIEKKPATSFTIPPEPEDRMTFRQNLQNYFFEYTRLTEIHGLRYLGERNRTIVEKICWQIALIIALILCIFLIRKVYQKWETTPIIVNFATVNTPIWQVPFPAVTICPEAKWSPKLFNYTKLLNQKRNNETIDKDEELKFSYITFVCSYYPKITYNVENYLDPEDMFGFFQNVSPPFFDNVFGCDYMGEPYNCSELFTPIITDDGLCYSFNLLGREEMLADDVVHYKNFHVSPKKSDWSLERGYKENANKDTYPRRALQAGVSFAFEMKFRVLNEDVDSTCGSIHGYKIQIHQPAVFPRVKQQHFYIPFDQAVMGNILPKMILTSEAIQAYTAEKRYCFVSHERTLKYFKVYTQHNCQIECRANFTLKKCGCVDFYMPRDKNTKLCGVPLHSCMLKAQAQLLDESIQLELHKMKRFESKYEFQSCNCLPECTYITYLVENSQSEWEWARKYQAEGKLLSFNKSTGHMSLLRLYFKTHQFVTSKRSELFGHLEFLAKCGGLLSLFTGFSVLLGFEMLYFFTIRIVCNVILFGAKFWAGKNKSAM